MNREYIGVCSGFGDTNGETGRVFAAEGGLRVAVADRPLEELPYSDLALSLGGHGDSYLCFTRISEPTIRVMIRDKSIVATLRRLGAPRSLLSQWDELATRRARRSSSWVAVLLGLVVVIGLMVWGVSLAVPRLANQVVARVPAEWEQEIGRLGASQILAEHPVCTDEELTRAMGIIATRLAGGLKSVPQGLKVTVIDAPEINAVALPAGYIFIHRELVEAADSAEEVAGVLAHEMQHVVLRHGLANLVRQAGLLIIVGALLGDAGGLEQFLGYNALGLLSMQFSREQESEADREGLRLLRSAAIPAQPMVGFFEKLAVEESQRTIAPEILSTHPDSATRAVELSRMIDALPNLKSRSFEIDWAKLKKRCGSERVADPANL